MRKHIHFTTTRRELPNGHSRRYLLIWIIKVKNKSEQFRRNETVRICLLWWRRGESVFVNVRLHSCESSPKQSTHAVGVGALLCLRAVKRCVNVGKNSKKYTRKLLDQLEFDYLFLYMTNSGFSPFSSYEHIRRKSIFATIPKHMPKSLSS